MTRFRSSWVLLLAAATSLFAYLAMLGLHLHHGTLTHAVTPQTIGWYLLAAAAYVVGVWRVARHPDRWLVWIWGAAILFRLALLFTTPTLSDDVYRYLWDGHVANHGVSPYALPIEAPELDYLEIPIRKLANHTWMASPYLPAAQWLFAGVTRFLPVEPFSMQAAMVVLDLLSALLIMALLRLAAMPTSLVIVYLWNPLVVVETAHGAHVDAWMIFLTLLAVWLTFGPSQAPHLAAQRNRRSVLDRSRGASVGAQLAAPLSLALATLTKLLPGLLLPVLFWRWRWWQLLLYGAATVGLLIPDGVRAGWGLIGPLDGRGLFAALRIYGDQWNYNSGLFRWLELAFASETGLGLQPDDANSWAKRMAALLLLATLLYVWIRSRREHDLRALLRLMAIPMAAYLLLTPTVHPWYALVVLAFTPFLAPAKTNPPRSGASSCRGSISASRWSFLI
ncbi:MAG: hypothetical protein HC802_12860 [Caldilineaceae bacterium]|nr:hypothetical protein [Caldilineaceae bacterium]